MLLKNKINVHLTSGNMIFPVEAPLLGCVSDRLVTKLGNGAIPPTSGNPGKSLKFFVTKI